MALYTRQDEINRAVYNARGVYRYYLSNTLTPPETACLLKYQPHISGRDVLDIGVGAGRTTRYLAPLARRYEAIDISPVMVDYLKGAIQGIRVHLADFGDLGIFGDRSFDFILATDNVIDAVSHENRLEALREASRVLRKGGIMALSSHNIHYKNAFSGPKLSWSSDPARFAKNCARYAVSMWNHVRVAPLRQTSAEYALLNDPGHFYACLHYYSSRSTLSSQLSAAGMRLIDAFDIDGQAIGEHEDDSRNPSLFYVAELIPQSQPAG